MPNLERIPSNGNNVMAHDNDQESDELDSRYEFRVWGKYPKARKMLARMASSTTQQRFEDCYLLIDDSEWNAKVRDSTLKIKQLIAERKGFERWSSNRYRTSEATPSPFDELFDELNLDRPQRGKKYEIERAVRELDPESGVRAVFVTKDRQRFRIDDLWAEVTDIEFNDSDEVLHTLSVEGDDLKALVALRKKLGLRGEPNVAMHQAIEQIENIE